MTIKPCIAHLKCAIEVRFDLENDSTSLHRLLMTVLTEKITGLITIATLSFVFSIGLSDVVLTPLLLKLLLQLFPAHHPCIGIT